MDYIYADVEETNDEKKGEAGCKFTTDLDTSTKKTL